MSARVGAIALAVALVFVAFPGGVLAEPGDLDPEFGKRGIVTTFLQGETTATDVFLQPGGAALVVAYNRVPGVDSPDEGLFFVRYRRDGSLDESFGSNGIVRPPGVELVPTAAAMGDDGDLTIAGPGPTIARFRPDGSLDQGFGNGGVATPPVRMGVGDTANGSDGSIYALGTIEAALSQHSYGVLKLRPDGTMAEDYGGDGFVEGPPGWDEHASSLAVDGADRAVFLTDRASGTLRRLTPAGELDTAFSGDGLMSLQQHLFPGGLAARPGGGYIVGIEGSGFPDRDLGVIAIADSGEVDTAFSGDGLAFAKVPGVASPFADEVAVQPDGRILVAGSEVYRRLAVVRFAPDGSPDPVFGIDGGTSAIFPGGDNILGGLAVAQDDRILLAGTVGEKRSGIGIASFGTPGPADLDADGRRDRSDRCPDIPAGTRAGCPFVDRVIEKFSYKRKTRFFKGDVRGEGFWCHEGRVRILERRPGRDRKIGSDRADSEFAVPAPPRPGAYYAVSPPELEPEAGICRAARSGTTRIRPRR